MIKMIAAASLNGVIGQNNNLPWQHDYPEDLKFFRQMTANSIVIMGRKTYESIGRPLPRRRNIIITHTPIKGMETYSSFEEALKIDTTPQCFTLGKDGPEYFDTSGDIWLIGGSSIYQEGLRFAEEIYLTTIPKTIEGDNLVYFPYVNPDAFEIYKQIEIAPEKGLHCTLYKRK